MGLEIRIIGENESDPLGWDARKGVGCMERGEGSEERERRVMIVTCMVAEEVPQPRTDWAVPQCGGPVQRLPWLQRTGTDR